MSAVEPSSCEKYKTQGNLKKFQNLIKIDQVPTMSQALC